MKSRLKIYPDGMKIWFLGDKRHRIGGPAVIFPDGKIKKWRQHDELHREDGPAIIINDKGSYVVLSHTWYIKGKRHREDGPAFTNYKKQFKHWSFNGEDFYSQKQWLLRILTEKLVM